MERRWLRLSAGLLGLLLILAVPGQAVESRRLAVLDFGNLSDLAAQDVEYLTDSIVRGEIRKILPQTSVLRSDEGEP